MSVRKSTPTTKSSLVVKELDAKERCDEALLDLFQRSRERVVKVAATHLLPDCIAVTTANGFIELIETGSGEFRLFLTHLDHIPLDTALRCFALVPSLFFARGRHPHLLYSLAYSNELLLGELDSGDVTVLGTFSTRPSCAFCDGDYIVCGEGAGQVSVWQASAEDDAAPTHLWRHPVLDDTVMCLCVHRNLLVCCSAAFECCVVGVDTGAVVAKLALEPEAAIAALPLVKPLVGHAVLAICLPSHITVFAEAEAGAANEWVCVGDTALRTEVQCVTCVGEFLGAGTASGIVLLYQCNAVTGEVSELVRFDVGYGVVGMQLHGSGGEAVLVVVTSTGDVWKWPVKELLQLTPPKAARSKGDAGDGEAKSGDGATPAARSTRFASPPPLPQEITTPTEHSDTQMGDDDGEGGRTVLSDEEDEQREEDEPRPSRPPAPTASHDHSPPGDDTAPSEVVVEMNVDSDHEDQDGANVSHGPPAAPIGQSPSPGEASTSHGSSVAVALTGTEPHAEPHCDRWDSSAATDGSGERGAAPQKQTTPISDPSPSHEGPDARAEVSGAAIAKQPLFHADEQRVVPASLPSGAERATLSQHSTDVGAVAVVTTEPPTQSPLPSQAGAVVAVERALGPAAVIQGLRHGRRMDPRKVADILVNANDDKNEVKNGTGEEGRGVVAQSSALLEEQRTALQDATFDYDQYANAHRLEAEALRYRYPVKLPTFALSDHVFQSVTPQICDSTPGDTIRSPGALPEGNTKDDLIDVTYGKFVRKKDPLLEEERRRGGPDINRHPCEDLIYLTPDPSATVLFKEYQMKPAAPQSLLLPMPLPPTPSVF